MPLIVGHKDPRGLDRFVAGVIVHTDSNDVLPSVLVGTVSRRLEGDREGIAAIRCDDDLATRLDAAVLIGDLIGCRVWVHAGGRIRDRPRDDDRDELAVRWPQGLRRGSDGDRWRGRITELWDLT